MDYLMAIDLGSTNLKAAIYDLDGNLVASASRPTEKHTPPDHPEWVIWDPQQIWTGAAAAAKQAVSQVDDPTLIRAVAVTGMGMDGVPVDDAGEALYPFISWHDPRTAPQAAWWAEHVGVERTFAVTGFPAWPITGAMRILWMNQHQPEIMARASKWLLIEDFLNAKLCGTVATDYSMASCMLLLDQAKHTWSQELLDLAGIERSLLPEPHPSGTRLGSIRPVAAEATGLSTDTKVVLGGHDHICGVLPVGAYRSRALFNVIGTWESVIASTPSAPLTEAVRGASICVQSHVAPGMYAAWGGAPSGDALEWFRAQFGQAAEQQAQTKGGEVWDHLLAALADTAPGAGGAMFLPHLSAAGCPVDDSRSMGAFVGLGNQTTHADMLRAVIEGLNYQFLHIMEVMESALAKTFDEIIVSGGSARNAFWIQNKADMIGRPIQVSEISDATPRGAAMLAGVGVGLYEDIDAACERFRRPGRTVEPNPDATRQYAELFPIYKQIHPALANVSHAIFDRFKGQHA